MVVCEECESDGTSQKFGRKALASVRSVRSEMFIERLLLKPAELL